MPQIESEHRKKLHQNINARINAANSEIDKIVLKVNGEGEPTGERKKQSELTAKEVKSIEHLNKRIKELQVSIRLVFNTNWLIEQREQDIKTIATRIRDEFADLDVPTAEETEEQSKVRISREQEKNRLIARLNALTKAHKCNRKGCYTGRGYIGLNTSTGEFSLCRCTTDTIDYYKLHD